MVKITAEKLLKECAQLKEQKGRDYQGGMWKEEDYFPFGHQSYMQMIHTKYLRMRNIMEAEDTNFEALEDTLMDMAVYSCMYAAWIENQKDRIMRQDNSWANDILIMHNKHKLHDWIEKASTNERMELMKLRMRMLTEEFNETMQAYLLADEEEMIDGLIDLCVIAIGTLDIAGV